MIAFHNTVLSYTFPNSLSHTLTQLERNGFCIVPRRRHDDSSSHNNDDSHVGTFQESIEGGSADGCDQKIIVNQ